MQRTKVNKTGNAWKKIGLKGSVPLGGGGRGKRLHHPSLLPSCSGPAQLEKKEIIH